MKMFFYLLSIFGVLLMVSCNNETEETPNQKEYLIVTQEVIENYDKGSVTKEVINYIYERDTDVFWKKAEFLDSVGKVFKTITREFDLKRFPIKEIIEDGTGINEIYTVEYSPMNYELLSRIEYEGEQIEKNKVRSIKYKYDSLGYLIAEESFKYNRDSGFVNIDGNNISEYQVLQPIIPSISRPKGNFLIAADYSILKMYLTKTIKERTSTEAPIGSLFFSIEQKRNEKGIPEYSKILRGAKKGTPEPNLAEEEWYQIEYDGLSNLLSHTGYCNSTTDSSLDENKKSYFEYDDAGMIKTIKEFKYNPKSKEYDMIHNLQQYEWIGPKINSPRNIIDYSLNEERTCYHRSIYSASVKKIERYDSTEKVVIYSECSYPLDKKPEKPEPNITKKISYKLKKIIINKN